MVITEETSAALAKLLKTHPVADMKADFAAAHRAGMDALKRRDYDALGDAIARERDVIDTITKTIKRTKRST